MDVRKSDKFAINAYELSSVKSEIVCKICANRDNLSSLSVFNIIIIILFCYVMMM